MKKLNLDETWSLCLSMWRWIAKEKRTNKCRSTQWLKSMWIENHGLSDTEILNNCFFCEYKHYRDMACNNCPGAKIDKDFRCNVFDYSWNGRSIKFYNKLVQLNKIRLAKRK